MILNTVKLDYNDLKPWKSVRYSREDLCRKLKNNVSIVLIRSREFVKTVITITKFDCISLFCIKTQIYASIFTHFLHIYIVAKKAFLFRKSSLTFPLNCLHSSIYKFFYIAFWRFRLM
jgi:hypothetical protein